MMENFEASLWKALIALVFVHGKNHARKKASLENGSWVIDFSLAVSSTDSFSPWIRYGKFNVLLTANRIWTNIEIKNIRWKHESTFKVTIFKKQIAQSVSLTKLSRSMWKFSYLFVTH